MSQRGRHETDSIYLFGSQPDGCARSGYRVDVGVDKILLIMRVYCDESSLVFGAARCLRPFVILQFVHIFQTLS